ncbi:hypothetical protein CCHL11_02593, partial [Colletotrichum chlorophyti]
MFKLGLFFAGAWCLVAQSALAQQLPTIKTSYETLSLSGRCSEALYTTAVASSVGLLDQDGLLAVCDDTCRNSLVDFRAKISSSCGARIDTIQYSSMSYPATYIVDRYLYFHDVSCYKDRVSGDFCDAVVAGWGNETSGSEAHFCDDCWLGPMSVQLSSPIGYNTERADGFTSLTRSCSVDNYSTTTPPPYGDASAAALAGFTTTATATATATADTGSSAMEVTPPIYPLLELGTAFRPRCSLQKRDRQLNPHAPSTAEGCPEYQNFRPFELIRSQDANRDSEDLDDYGINGCRYTAIKHGIS